MTAMAAGNTAYNVRLSSLYGAWFLVLGVQVPFWPVWLEAGGLDASEIGLVLTVGLLMRVVSSPVFAQLADHYGYRRNLIIILAWASLASYSLFAMSSGFAAIMAVTALSSCFFPSIIPLTDNLSLLHARDRGLHYGRLRLWGSITFVLASIAGGAMVGLYSEEVVLWLILGGLAVMIAAASLAPREEGAAALRGASFKPLERFRTLFRMRNFVLLLAAAGTVQAGHGVYYVFGTIYWRQIGLADNVIGGLWALGVFAEIVLFAVIGGISGRISSASLLLMGAAAGVARWSLMPFAHGLAFIALLQCLHAFTFGATHLAAIQYMARNVPVELSATAQSLYTALSLGMIIAVSVALSGYLFEAIGAGAYWVMAGFSAIGFGAAMALRRDQRSGS